MRGEKAKTLSSIFFWHTRKMQIVEEEILEWCMCLSMCLYVKCSLVLVICSLSKSQIVWQSSHHTHTLNQWMLRHMHSHRHTLLFWCYLCVKKITIFIRKQAHLCHISSDNLGIFRWSIRRQSLSTRLRITHSVFKYIRAHTHIHSFDARAWIFDKYMHISFGIYLRI